MAFCKYCGHKLESDAVFCAGCGKKLATKSPEQPTVDDESQLHTLIIKLSKNAGVGEKPKVYLDNQEVGKVSTSKELLLSITAGHHTILLKGLAGGGIIADIKIEPSDNTKICVFDVNFMSVKERYFLESIYSENTNFDGNKVIDNNTKDENFTGSTVNEATTVVLNPVSDTGKNKSHRRLLISCVLIGIFVITGFFVMNNVGNDNRSWAEKQAVAYLDFIGANVSSCTYIETVNGYYIFSLQTYTENGLGMKKYSNTYYLGVNKDSSGSAVFSPYDVFEDNVANWCASN